MAELYPFDLRFTNDSNGTPFFAPFNFIFNGVPQEKITCGISSIYAGDMKYGSENKDRKNLFTELGFDPACVYSLNQIHSQNVLAVDKNNPPQTPADGMAANDRDIVLSVTVADCLPIFLLDTKSGAFGIVHSGWKGTGIVAVALNLMKKNWGTLPIDVAAILGPCIDSCCYRVDQERAFLFEKDFGADCVRKFGGEFFLDMKTANVKLLTEAGVENIALCNDCTYTDKRLGSFRREGNQFTHMAAFIGRRNN
jgi:YfiH family protein